MRGAPRVIFGRSGEHCGAIKTLAARSFHELVDGPQSDARADHEREMKRLPLDAGLKLQAIERMAPLLAFMPVLLEPFGSR